jgi:hypothetical protein
MYAVAIIRYRKPLEEVIAHQDAHRAYLRGLKDKGVLIASVRCSRVWRALSSELPVTTPGGSTVRDHDPFSFTASHNTS